MEIKSQLLSPESTTNKIKKNYPLSSEDYSSPVTTYTPNRLPVKKTPVTMWDLIALQDAYQAKLE